jgi:excisionase family DNA binding protein
VTAVQTNGVQRAAVLLDEPLLDASDAARLLRVRPSTIYEWVRTGKLPCLRLGPRAIRFTRSMLEHWAGQQVTNG